MGFGWPGPIGQRQKVSGLELTYLYYDSCLNILPLFLLPPPSWGLGGGGSGGEAVTAPHSPGLFPGTVGLLVEL